MVRNRLSTIRNHWSLITVLLVGFALVIPADRLFAADAQGDTGVLRGVDVQGRSVIFKKTTGELIELRVGGTTSITLDGKSVPLDVLKPGMKAVVRVDPGGDTIRSLKVEAELVKLRIAISKEGQCRVIVGRSIPERPVLQGEALEPIPTSYANSFVGNKSSASESRGSSRFKPEIPKFAKSSSMLLYPRALRLPCVLTFEIVELKDGSVGVQFLTLTTNIVVYIESEDGLRNKCKVIAVASSNDSVGDVPRFGNAQKRVKFEQQVELSEPDELRFKLPLSVQQLRDLYTIDVVLRAKPGQENPKPVVAISSAVLQARRDRTLGMELQVKEGKVVVERVDSGSLAAAAGIQPGDVVLALDGNRLPVLKSAGGLTLTFEFAVKTKSVLTILRDGKEQSATIRFE